MNKTLLKLCFAILLSMFMVGTASAIVYYEDYSDHRFFIKADYKSEGKVKREYRIESASFIPYFSNGTISDRKLGCVLQSSRVKPNYFICDMFGQDDSDWSMTGARIELVFEDMLAKKKYDCDFIYSNYPTKKLSSIKVGSPCFQNPEFKLTGQVIELIKNKKYDVVDKFGIALALWPTNRDVSEKTLVVDPKFFSSNLTSESAPILWSLLTPPQTYSHGFYDFIVRKKSSNGQFTIESVDYNPSYSDIDLVSNSGWYKNPKNRVSPGLVEIELEEPELEEQESQISARKKSCQSESEGFLCTDSQSMRWAKITALIREKSGVEFKCEFYIFSIDNKIIGSLCIDQPKYGAYINRNKEIEIGYTSSNGVVIKDFRLDRVDVSKKPDHSTSSSSSSSSWE